MKYTVYLFANIACVTFMLTFVGCSDDVHTDTPSKPVEDIESLGKSDTAHATQPDSTDASQDGSDEAIETDDPPPEIAQYYAIDVASWLVVSDGPDDENPEEWTAGMTGLARRVLSDDGQVQLEISPCFVTLPEVDDREVKIKNSGLYGAQPAQLNVAWSKSGESDRRSRIQGL